MGGIDLAKKLISIIMISLIVMLSCACSHEPESPEDQLIYYNISSEPFTLDPQIANDAGARLVILNIFEGLVRQDAENNITPGAAESWDISGDRMMYTFHLRDGLQWNDGTALSADDFLYGLKRTLQPETGSPTAGTLYCIKNAEKINKGELDISALGVFATDSKTLIIQLEYPESDFLQLMTTPPAMPCSKQFFEKTAGQYGRDDDKLLTNGAFYVRESGWAHDEYLYLRKNTAYVGKDKPVPAGVNITIGKDQADICSAISSGIVDCGAISAADKDRADALGFHLTGFGDTVWGISFNMKNDITKNKNFRLGLLSSLDRNKILGGLSESCQPTENIIPDSAELDGKTYRTIAGNVNFTPSDNYRQLLDKGLKELKLTAFPDITILCADDEGTQIIVNNMIQTWNELTGSYINKKPVPLSDLKDRIADENFDIVIAPLTIEGSTPLSTLELFESESKYNAAALSSQEYDSLTESIRHSLTESSGENIRKAEQYLIDNAVFYPLYTENRYYASAGNVEGILFHPFGAEADFFYAAKTVEDS